MGAIQKLSENYYSDPLPCMKSMGLPLRVDDKGNAVVPDMKVQSDKMKRIIRENNNPIELNHKIDYK
jgi:hypothetical protein